MAYDSAGGDVVRVEQVQATPSSVGPGGTVSLVTTDTVLTPQADRSLAVRETRGVRHNGVLVANPTTEFTRQGGTFTSAVPITVQSTASSGTYEVTITVAVGDRLSGGVQ